MGATDCWREYFTLTVEADHEVCICGATPRATTSGPGWFLLTDWSFGEESQPIAPPEEVIARIPPPKCESQGRRRAPAGGVLEGFGGSGAGIGFV